MKTPFTGGCLCGAIRYECSAEPVVMGNCHCRDCQRATGTAFAAGMLVPRNAVTIRGDVKYYDVVGDSGGIVSRGFCPICGSRLFSKPPIPELIGIMAGSLDDPSGFQPGMDLYTASAQLWDYMNPDLPKYAKFPLPNNAVAADC
ncbi:MAG: GFA family protein [Leptolyngbyaceae cyanobacterium SU_3_3]|nr:GFA family protein [Leptolyngbyaceae cyanobacterium SU_3_3]